MEKLNCFYLEHKTLKEISTEDFQQKELKRYIKIKNILPLEYYSLNCSEDKNQVLNYLVTKIDKRVKSNQLFPNVKSFYIMLIAFRNLEWTGATSLELKEIKKEFKQLSSREIENLIEDLHKKRIITWESRADLNQIRFKL